jgi:hypothetical protein
MNARVVRHQSEGRHEVGLADKGASDVQEEQRDPPPRLQLRSGLRVRQRLHLLAFVIRRTCSTLRAG